MEKLSFKLFVNNKEEINDNVNYFIKDNIINFKIKEDTYKYNLDNSNLIKSNKEYTIEVNIDKKLVLISLNGYTFEMNITKHNIERKEKEIIFEYTYEGEEITNNKIIIKY